MDFFWSHFPILSLFLPPSLFREQKENTALKRLHLDANSAANNAQTETANRYSLEELDNCNRCINSAVSIFFYP